MGRRKLIKVRCKKDYTDFIPEDIMTDNGLNPEHDLVFKKGEVYNISRDLNTMTGAIICIVYSKIKHNYDPWDDYSKWKLFINDRFYIKYSDDKITRRKEKIDKFHEYKEKGIFKDMELSEWISPLENKFDDYFEKIN